MDIHHLITDRWSPVAFDRREVEPEKLSILFNAAMWAPSSRNAQPWRFIYATRADHEYPQMFDLLDEDNKSWARTAPVIAISIAQTISDYKNRPNYYAFYDSGMAVGNLLIQATHLDLFVHQMGGYDMDRARTMLKIPAGFEPVAMMAIGYKGDPKILEKSDAEREQQERIRNRIHDHVFKGKWPDY